MGENIVGKMGQQRITQHKRFVPYGTHPNSAFGGTSFMLETLGKIHFILDNIFNGLRL